MSDRLVAGFVCILWDCDAFGQDVAENRRTPDVEFNVYVEFLRLEIGEAISRRFVMFGLDSSMRFY